MVVSFHCAPSSLVRMVFRSFLSPYLGRTSNRSALWCYRYGGNAAPYPFPSAARHSKKIWVGVWLFRFFDVNLRQQFTAEKRTRAPLTISWLKSAVCKEVFPSLTSPLKLRIWNRVKRERAAPTHRPQKQIAWLTTDVTTAPKSTELCKPKSVAP